jgi:hypothetical protein
MLGDAEVYGSRVGKGAHVQPLHVGIAGVESCTLAWIKPMGAISSIRSRLSRFEGHCCFRVYL